MKKRERENPCSVCGHYHKFEEGEVCGICGHRMPENSEKIASASVHVSAFPSEIVSEFLFLGSYDDASQSALLKDLGISRILNTVPSCQNLYNLSFTYCGLQDEKTLQFDDAIQFLEQCEKDKARVLVHCMSGKNRSPAIVIGYLMKRKGWRLDPSHQWVKERRPSVDISSDLYRQLQEFEQKLFGSVATMSIFPSSDAPAFAIGFRKADDQPQVPAFNNVPASSIFSCPHLNIPPEKFTFGANHFQRNPPDPNGDDIPMDGL